MLTPFAKAAKHRRAKDKKWRETMCWWIVNDKVCPHGDQCNFRHTVSETGASSPSPTPEMCETGVSWPSLATEQDKSETGVSSPGPSTNPTHPRSPTRDSWNNSWDRFDYRDKWTDVWKDGHDGNKWIHGWNEYYHGDVWTDAWRERNSGFVCQHDDDNLTDAWNKCKPDDEWHASHWKTSSLELEPLGDERMERYRRVHQRSQRTDAVKSFVLRDEEHEPVDQLSVQGQ